MNSATRHKAKTAIPIPPPLTNSIPRTQTKRRPEGRLVNNAESRYFRPLNISTTRS
jgi:hypothetical protein